MILKNLIKNYRLFPKKVAIQDEKISINYEQLLNHTFQTLEYLEKKGIKKSSKVLVLMDNSVEFAVLFICSLAMRFTIIPINNFDTQNLNSLVKELKIKFIVSKKEFKPILNKQKRKIIFIKFKEVNNEIYFKNIYKEEYFYNEKKFDYIISFSSGSTGEPKKIVLSEEVKYNRAKQTINYYNLTSKDNFLICTPFQYTLAQRVLHISLILGAKLTISNFFTPASFSYLIKKNKITFVMMISFQINRLIESTIFNRKKNFKSLRHLICSSDTLSLKNKFYLIKNLKCDTHEIFGMAELGVISNLNLKKDKNKLNSVGKILHDTKVKIVNKQKNEKIEGEITCLSPRIFDAYLKKKTIKSKKNSFFKTGDIGYLDKKNFLYFCGRKKNVIKVSGTSIYPQSIEKVILRLSDVKECKVIGIPNSMFGEIIVALVQKKTHKKINESQIRDFCRKNLPEILQPRVIKFISKFPKNNMGKVLIEKLKDNFKGVKLDEKFNLS
tara:strand:+ start:2983 stop:4473 length:1491 start_codon:yes stop_codon:yes gene_type:complete